MIRGWKMRKKMWNAKIMIAFIMFISFSFLFQSKGFALPFDSEGWVSPNWGNSWDSITLTGTARYSLYINTPGVNVTSGAIAFENDIFDVSVLDSTDVTFISPPTWGPASIFVIPDSNTSNNTTSVGWVVGWGGTAVTDLTDPIIIEVNYKL